MREGGLDFRIRERSHVQIICANWSAQSNLHKHEIRSDVQPGMHKLLLKWRQQLLKDVIPDILVTFLYVALFIHRFQNSYVVSWQYVRNEAKKTETPAFRVAGKDPINFDTADL